jgi:uncharacterized MnhB-related membrane protein
MIYLKLIFLFYLIGVFMTFIVGFEGISRHITLKGVIATTVMSIFSWFVLFYVVFGDDSKNYKDF